MNDTKCNAQLDDGIYNGLIPIQNDVRTEKKNDERRNMTAHRCGSTSQNWIKYDIIHCSTSVGGERSSVASRMRNGRQTFFTAVIGLRTPSADGFQVNSFRQQMFRNLEHFNEVHEAEAAVDRRPTRSRSSKPINAPAEVTRHQFAVAGPEFHNHADTQKETRDWAQSPTTATAISSQLDRGSF